MLSPRFEVAAGALRHIQTLAEMAAFGKVNTCIAEDLANQSIDGTSNLGRLAWLLAVSLHSVACEKKLKLSAHIATWDDPECPGPSKRQRAVLEVSQSNAGAEQYRSTVEGSLSKEDEDLRSSLMNAIELSAPFVVGMGTPTNLYMCIDDSSREWRIRRICFKPSRICQYAWTSEFDIYQSVDATLFDVAKEIQDMEKTLIHLGDFDGESSSLGESEVGNKHNDEPERAGHGETLDGLPAELRHGTDSLPPALQESASFKGFFTLATTALEGVADRLGRVMSSRLEVKDAGAGINCVSLQSELVPFCFDGKEKTIEKVEFDVIDSTSNRLWKALVDTSTSKEAFYPALIPLLQEHAKDGLFLGTFGLRVT
ncbi:hypothetical protein GGR50DRAFT_677334 [Xylaria sp. CBS 124048]|nr:hypothetical protein GGR50DRAFT_677334 [Xylaria sp. CBS 124048]